MAARTEERVRRKNPAVQSAVPYLTSTAVPKPQRRELPEERPVVRERKPQKAIRTKPQMHPISSGFTVVGLLTAAFLIMLVISGYVQLYEATSEVADLNDELETVQQEQATLQSQYESKIDLDYVEQVATTQLGMLQPAPNQVVYLDLYSEFVNENGELPAEASKDGVHLRSDWCKQWLTYLQTHTVDFDTLYPTGEQPQV